ncbi:hypothetical protein D5085_09815 [Ectothiorhodospiraceae bacterium BW-2]|nr:hypothetical protein D5085_09815 [Ectothiorhodospiraceae bacterium BW-2]
MPNPTLAAVSQAFKDWQENSEKSARSRVRSGGRVGEPPNCQGAALLVPSHTLQGDLSRPFLDETEAKSHAKTKRDKPITDSSR